MKQINVWLEDDLVVHLEKLSKIISLLKNKEVTIPDIVARSTEQYFDYKKVIIETTVNNNKIETTIKSSVDNCTNLSIDDLIIKICKEDW